MTSEVPHLKLVTDGREIAPSDATHELDWSILMAHAQAGDGRAYRRLLIAMTPYLRARALRRLGSADEAEDAVQDTLLTIHDARHSYDPTRPFGPWLVAIADRRTNDRLRRRHRRRAVKEALKDFVTDVASPPDQSVLDARALDAAIAQLTPEQARAVRLLKLEERTLEEAAMQTGQSVGALKAATHRALQGLRRRLFEGPLL